MAYGVGPDKIAASIGCSKTEAKDLLDRFAKDAGCAGVEFVGRPGWRKQANKYGYSIQSVMYQKLFEDRL
jgi:hypothetical protein